MYRGPPRPGPMCSRSRVHRSATVLSSVPQTTPTQANVFPIPCPLFSHSAVLCTTDHPDPGQCVPDPVSTVQSHCCSVYHGPPRPGPMCSRSHVHRSATVLFCVLRTAPTPARSAAHQMSGGMSPPLDGWSGRPAADPARQPCTPIGTHLMRR